jgi:erythronate-4-phosphate dehydrogenase
MKIVVDEKIPYIRGAFEPWADVVYSPGRFIDAAMVADADALIIRTRTRCNSNLLKDSRVKIIASATIGYDHLDTAWLESKGIRWVNAPGCNSGSVMQYLVSVLLYLTGKYSLDLSSLTLGVVGVGNVGSKVVRAARTLGMNVLQNDPPRQRREGLNDFLPLGVLIAESDIITLHVPLTHEGEDRTFHHLNCSNLPRLKKSCILINTSRGGVVDNAALREALSDRKLRAAVLDVWEGEPVVDRRLLELVDIATPHIAGYSVDGKANATINSVREVSSFLGLPLSGWEPDSLPEPAEPVIDLSSGLYEKTTTNLVSTAVIHTYPVDDDDRLFRSDPDNFEYLRDNYRIRREFSSYTVKSDDPETSKILNELGFNIIQKLNIFI